MKKKLLFVAAMMLAAFGASAEATATADLVPVNVSPTPGTMENPAVVEEPEGWSYIKWVFDSPIFLQGKKEYDTVAQVFSTMMPGIDDPTYGLIFHVESEGRALVGYIAKENENGTFESVTITEPDTFIIGFYGASPAGDEEWAMDQTKGHCMDISTTYWYTIPKVLTCEVSPAPAVLDMAIGYVGGFVDTLKQVTLTFDEKTYLAKGASTVQIEGDMTPMSEKGFMEYGVGIHSMRIDLAADGMSATLTPVGVDGKDTTFATPGAVIQVMIPDSTFGDKAFSKGEADCLANTGWGYTYNIAAYHVESVDPADGSELISLTPVTITFKEEIAGMVSDSAAFINLDQRDIYRGNIVLNDDKKSITINPQSRDIAEPGSYRLVIPPYSFGDADFVEMMTKYQYPAGCYNSELTFTYVIGEGLTGDITIDPADGSTVGGIHAITIDFGQPVEIAQFFDAEGNVVAAPLIEVKDAEGAVVATADNKNDAILHPEDDENGTKMTITFSDTVRAAGTYTIAIPKMFQYIESADNEAPAMNLTYTVDPALPMSVSPDSGSVLTAITNVYVVYANDYTIAKGKDTVIFHNPAATENGDYKGYLTKQGDTIVITPQSRDIATAGTYTVVIPGGALQMTSDPSKVNKELSLTYTVGEEQGGITITPSNGSTVKELKVFTIDLGAAGGPSYNTQEKITITNAAGEVVAEVDGETGVDPVDPEAWEEDEWVITFPTAVTTAGEYVLTIPMNFFNVGDEMNPVLHYYYTVDPNASAITEVEAAAEGVTVYNLQGVLVLQSDDAADVKTLENGLYIVNGKKVIIVK